MKKPQDRDGLVDVSPEAREQFRRCVARVRRGYLLLFLVFLTCCALLNVLWPPFAFLVLVGFLLYHNNIFVNTKCPSCGKPFYRSPKGWWRFRAHCGNCRYRP